MIKKQKAFASLREKEIKVRQEIIVDAAVRVFAAKSFKKVSMRDIAKESEISLSTIYRYFPDQQSLFLQALSRGIEKMRDLIHDLVNQEDVLVETVSEAFVGYLTENDQYFRMMTHFMIDGELTPDSIEKLNAIERTLLDEFDRLFLKLNGKEQTRLLSHAFFSALNGILITFRNYPGRDGEEVQQHMKQVGQIIAEMFTRRS